MLKNYALKLLALFIFTSLLSSCSQDDDYYSLEKKESKLLTKTKEWIKSKAVVDENDVAWNLAVFYQQSTEDTFVAMIPVKSSNANLLQKLVLEINSYNVTGKLWTFNFEDSQRTIELQTISTHKILESFTGELKITNLETMEIRSDFYKNGISYYGSLFSKSTGNGTCDNCHGGGIQLDEVIITPNPNLPWFPDPFLNPSGPSIPIPGVSIGSPQPQITNNLEGKEKCLNDLLDKKGDSFVQDIFKNFKGKSEFNIKIGSKEQVFVTKNGVTYEVNGATHPPKNNLIQIDISSSRINGASALDATRTILHEYIHADIFRKLNTTADPTAALNFKNTYEAYESQHGAMAALYLQSMTDALKDFHKNILTSDYNKYTDYYGEAPSDAFYEAMAWGGLKDNDVAAWKNLSPEKKAEIENLARRNNLLTKTPPCQN